MPSVFFHPNTPCSLFEGKKFPSPYFQIQYFIWDLFNIRLSCIQKKYKRCSRYPYSALISSFQKVAVWRPSIVMVAIKKIQSPPSLPPPLPQNEKQKGRTLYDILHDWLMRRTARFITQVCYCKRKKKVCLVAKTIYFNITKLLRPCNITQSSF